MDELINGPRFAGGAEFAGGAGLAGGGGPVGGVEFAGGAEFAVGVDLTIGVVIDLPEPHATVVRRWRQRVGDPQADLIPPHVTLLPPTTVPEADLKAVLEQLAEAAELVAPFAMHLSGTGTFRPLSQVVFVQVARGIAQCEVLETAIRRGVLARTLEFPFHPHVTVAHDIDEAALDIAYEGLSDFVARFHVDRFALYVRGEDGAWTTERDFALKGG